MVVSGGVVVISENGSDSHYDGPFGESIKGIIVYIPDSPYVSNWFLF